MSRDRSETQVRSADLTGAKKRALRILERSDRSEYEIRQRLMNEYLPETVDLTIEYLTSCGYVDDRRYAVNYLEMRGREKGRRLSVYELVNKKGISGDIVSLAEEEVPAEDEREVIRYWMERKHIDPVSSDVKELRRFYRFMERRGFKSSDILSELTV